jgi:hypothetical protein
MPARLRFTKAMLPVLVLISGCAALKERIQSHPRPAAPTGIDPEYFTVPWDGETSSAEMKEYLSRSHEDASMRVIARPITQAMVEAEAAEDGRRRMDSEAMIQAQTKQELGVFITKSTCFFLSIATDALSLGDLKYWSAKLLLDDGSIIPLGLSNSHKIPSLVETWGHGFGASRYAFLNSTFACSAKPVKLDQTFALHLANDSYKFSLRLTWEVEAPTPETPGATPRPASSASP